VEHEGTYRLPEAQLDRFLFKIEVGYPSLENETRIIADYHNRKNTIDISSLQRIMKASDIAEYRAKAAGVHIEQPLIAYIAQIVNQTRNNSSLHLGASPRASLAILTSAKAIAAIRGRDFVTPDDIKFVCGPVLRHRVILTPEKEMEGSTPSEIIRQIIEKVEVPR
jgi:MoxR-like ATPase